MPYCLCVLLRGWFSPFLTLRRWRCWAAVQACALAALLATAVTAAAQTPDAARTASAAQTAALLDPARAPQSGIQAASALLEKVQRALPAAQTAETLSMLAEATQKVQRDAAAAAAALEPLLAQLDARIAQLGPVPEDAPESADLTAQRSALAQERSTLDAAIRRAKLLAVEAEQTGQTLERARSQQFNAQISSRATSPLSPALWRQFAQHLPGDLQQLRALAREGAVHLRAALATHGWRMPVQGTLLALALVVALRPWLRRWGYRLAASAHAPQGRLRRTGLAMWLLVVGTVLPGVGNMLWIEHLHAIDAIAPAWRSVADAWVKSSFIAAFFLALSAALLAPERPSWRLLAIDDTAAPTLTRYAWGAAFLTWVSMMLGAVHRAVTTSAVSQVALDGVIALAYVALISGVLATLNQQRRRRAALAPADPAPTAAPSNGAAPSLPWRIDWLLLAWLGGHIAVLAALAAALWGYLNFAVLAATQMVWATVVVLATSLCMKFADDVCTWLFAAGSRSARALHQSSGLSAARLEQVGVLLSAVLRICLVVMGLSALTAPFGASNQVLDWSAAAAGGLPIGGTVLRPMDIVRAIAVLAAGVTLLGAFERWLVGTYLPKTELDIGARNSVSTVARYVGLIVLGLWALAALGIGLEKVALLASALSVGIGFGLQAITQNFVSGLILLAERPVRLGDRVRIGDQTGDIRRISVRATEIQTDDKATLIVPNSELITKAIHNLSRDTALGRISVLFAVPLATDMAALRALLLRIYAAHPAVLEAPAPTFFIDALQGSAVQINSSAHVTNPRDVYSTRSDVLLALLEGAAAQGIALVSATDIHVVAAAASAASALAMRPTAPPATPT